MSCVISPDGEYPTASRSNEEPFYNGLNFTVKPERHGIHGIYALCLRTIKQLVDRTSISSGWQAHVEFLMEEKPSPRLVRHVKVKAHQLSSHIKYMLYPSSISKMDYNLWDPSNNKKI
jgi:hypothetical protein